MTKIRSNTDFKQIKDFSKAKGYTCSFESMENKTW